MSARSGLVGNYPSVTLTRNSVQHCLEPCQNCRALNHASDSHKCTHASHVFHLMMQPNDQKRSKDISDSRMRAHCISESPSPSRLFSTTAQNVPTGRAAPVTHDHLPRCSILFKVSPITSSGDAVGRSGDYRMPIRSGSITICRMIGRPFSTTREACRDLRFSWICQIGCQRFSFRC